MLLKADATSAPIKAGEDKVGSLPDSNYQSPVASKGVLDIGTKETTQRSPSDVSEISAHTATSQKLADSPAGPDGKAGSNSSPGLAQKLQQVQQRLPPAKEVAEVVKEALVELKDGGKETVTLMGRILEKLKNHRPINITLDQLLTGLFYGFLLFQFLLIKLLKPSPWWLLVFLPTGIACGLGLSYLYFANKKRKAEACQVLGMELGPNAMLHLLGNLPTWISYTEREKVTWLNSVLEEVWPYYDKGVCKMVKSLTEDIFKNALTTNKGVPIKSIAFKQLTFGDAPFRVESIYVSDKHKDSMVLEVDVRWCGEANITLAIELLAGDFTKMCPKVTDISFVGSLRIVLKPLVNKIPGFGAAIVTFKKPPRVKYRLDFGKALGGPYISAVVKPFINMVINNLIIAMLVWPQRLVIPMPNTGCDDIEIERMSYRHQGVIKVTVVHAKGLKKADLIGSSDPFVELTTDGSHTVTSKVIKNNVNPVWNQTFWLLVQEPTSQIMQVNVYDKDFFSAKELLTLNIGDTFGSKELLGRCAVKLKEITAGEGEVFTRDYALGTNDFSSPEGCGKGAGTIQLSSQYRSFESFRRTELENSTHGTIIVTVREARNLPRGTGRRADDPLVAYVRCKVEDQMEQTRAVWSKGDHSFKQVLEFHNIRRDKDVKVKLFEKSMLGDDELHEEIITVQDIMDASDQNALTGKHEVGFMCRWFKLSTQKRVSTGGASDAPEKGLPCLAVHFRYVPNFGQAYQM